MLKQKLFLYIITILTIQSFVIAQNNIIEGRIIDKETKYPLPGARITLFGTSFGNVSNLQGYFKISNVPNGDYKLKVSYIGYEPYAKDVKINNSQTLVLEIPLTSKVIVTDEVVVTGMLEGQLRAMNQEKTADNVKNIISSELVGKFPDLNVAESIQRLPGISIQRDQGEGRYILIRGMEARLSSAMINNVRLPSPEGDIRTVALDVIPSDLISSIEVTKTLTPEMDADAIGGSVNIITKQSSDYPGEILKATLAGGYNQIVSDYNFQTSLTYANRFGKDKNFGFMVSGSFYNTNRGSDNNEFQYKNSDFGFIPVNTEFRDYVINRKRIGLSSTIDYNFNQNSQIFIKGIFNQFDDYEYRRRLRFKIKDDGFISSNIVSQYWDEDDGEYKSAISLERELKDRFESQQINSLALGGKHALGNIDLNYQIAYSYAQEKEPGRRDITFKRSVDSMVWDRNDYNFPTYNLYTLDDNRQGTLNNQIPFDYQSFKFDDIVTEDNLTTDQDINANFDIKIPFNIASYPLQVKIGAKYRGKNKDRNNDVKKYDRWNGDNELTLDQLLGDYTDNNFLDGKYEIGKSIDPDKAKDFFDDNKANFELNPFDTELDTYSANYEAKEDILAGYLQGKLYIKDFVFLFGGRIEVTNIEYKGWELNINEDEQIERSQVIRQNNYSNFFPMLLTKYIITENTNIRASVTTSIARPKHFNLVPYTIINRLDEEISLGNPDLKPTESVNIDLMFDHYFQPIGMLSAGLFYKSLKNYIFEKHTIINSGDFTGYQSFQPINGDKATLYGFEISWQHQFTFLPDFWNGFGIFLNYTYTKSEANYPMLDYDDKEIIRKGTLPGQASNILNIALSFEKYGVRTRLAANFHGNYVDLVGLNEDYDIYYDNHLQLDFFASYLVTKNISVFMELLNLTNAPLRYYMGITERPIQQEFYKMWGHLGVRYEL